MTTHLDFKALAIASADSALAFEWLNVDIDLSRGVVDAGNTHGTLVPTFDIVKSLRRPVDMIPATLHPVS